MASARVLGAAVAAGMIAAALAGGSDAHACCEGFVVGISFPGDRPRNTLVWIWREDQPPSLRRTGTGRGAGSVPLVPLGAGDLWRPAWLLEAGAEYEVVVGPDVMSRFTVEGEVDVSPPAFAGVSSVTLRRHGWQTSADNDPVREIIITHDPIPYGVAFLVVNVRRHGPGETPVRRVIEPKSTIPERRDLTVLSSNCGFDEAPLIEVGATYCVSVVAHDAAGNASGGDVEVCSPVIDCRDPGWRDALRCYPPWGAVIYPPDPDEIQLKEMTVPAWPTLCARATPWLLALVGLIAGWRWSRRRRRTTTVGSR